MIRKTWLEICGRTASVAVVSLFTSAFLGNAIHAQTAQSILGAPVVRPATPPAFLVAPSVSLGYSPTAIASGHLTSSGKLDLVTADYNGGTITVFAGLGHATFASGIKYAAGAQPASVTIADFDGDGKADVILANTSENVISVFAGNGDGTLGPRKTYPVGFAPSFVAVGDFSESGKPDVAVAGAGGKTLAILQNDGTGNLKRAVNFALAAAPAALLAADLNHDGHLDLAVATAAGSVTVLLGKGNGQFSALPDMSLGAGALSSIAVGDFNRDGNPDLVVTATAQNQVAVLLGHGDGKFAPAAFSAVGNSPVAAHVADVDGDGLSDLIVINKGSNTFSVLNGLGDGTFKSAAHFVVGNAPLAAAAGDFYSNGRVDLTTINQLGQTLSLPAGNGDGTFAAGRAYMAGVQPVAVASGDLAKTGRSDLVVASYCAADATCGGSGSAAVLLAAPDGVYQLSSTYAMGAGSVGIHLIDVNGDGKLDLVALNRVDKSLSIRLGAGDGTFEALTTIPLSASPVALAAVDFNNDGKIDLAVLGDCGSANCSQPGEVEILAGDGDSGFRSIATYAVGYSPVALAIGKTSAGGNNDLVIANRCGQDAACRSGGAATILFGDGTGSFRRGTDVPLGNSPSSIALADLRGLGILDLVVSRSADNTVAVLPGTGNGTFKTAIPYAVGHAPGALAIADFNGDGRPDVAVANTADSSVSVLLGNGATLQPAFSVPVAGNASSLAAVETTSVGRASIATASGSVASPATASSVTVVANLVVHAAGVTADTTTLTATPATATVNPASPVALNVTVTGGSGTPTGSVTITSNGTPATICTQPLDGTGHAACSTSDLQADVTTLTATYSGDPTYAITTGTAAITVNPLAPAVTFTPPASPASPSALNTAVTFTAALTGVTLTPVPPAGKMTFLLNNGPATCNGSGTANVINVNSSGVASCIIQNMPASATNTVTATYGSDPNYVPAAGGSAPAYNITALPATVSLAPTGTPATITVGTSATFTATVTASSVTPVAPSGTITFTINGSSSADCPPVKVNASQQAACTTKALVSPSDLIGATYSGDTNFPAAAGASYTELVTKAAPTVLLTAAPSPASVNQSVVFTATVPPPGSGTQTVLPSGSVTFTEGATTICPATVLNTAVNPPTAICNYAFPHVVASPGAAITATYSGDTNFTAGTNGTTSEVVNATGTTTTISSSSGLVGQAVTFNTVVTPAFPGTTLPAGTITFSTNASPAPTGTCTATLTLAANGTVPSCTLIFGTAGTFNVSATFHPSGTPADFLTSTSSNLAQVINSGSISVLLSSAPNPSSVNETAVISASFSPASPQVAPIGTVTYSDGATAITGCNALAIVVTGGVSSIPNCNYSIPTATSTSVTHSIQAKYSGDANYAGPINSNPLVQVVNRAAVATSINALSSSPSVNQSVTFTATLTPAFSGSTAPTGTVTFNQTLNGTTTSPCANQPVSIVAGVPVATCPTSFATTGAYTISAQYNGDANFVQGTATSRQVTVGTTGTTVTVAQRSTIATFFVNEGGGIFSATVTPSTLGTVSPSGNMTFADSVAGTTVCAPQTLAPNGDGTSTALCAIVFRAAGSHTITATFAGDTNFPTASGTSNITVSPTTTTTTLSSPGPVAANQSLTLTTVVTPTYPGTTIPKGTVAFAISPATPATGTCIAGVSLASDGSVPACTLTFPASGTFNITATFSGDTNFATSSSTALNQVIGKAGASISVDPQAPSVVNQSVSFTASFKPPIAGTQPTGSITYLDGATSICSTTIVTPGIIPGCSHPFATAGQHSITIAYGGDSNFSPLASPVTTQTVNQATTTAAVVSSSGPGATASSPVNQQVTFTATITPQISNALLSVPTGTVSFYDNSNLALPICQGATLSPAAGGAATAICKYTFTATGTNTISAAYSGDSNFVAVPQGNSTPVTQTVVKPNLTVDVTSAASAIVNQTVTYSVLITPGSAGTTTPTGTVTFTDANDNATLLCAAPTLVGNSTTGTSAASCQITFLNAGPHTISVSYPGDTNFTKGSGSANSLNVTPSTTSVTLNSGEPASFVTETVNFTAKVTPTPSAGAKLQVPAGSVMFGDAANTGLVKCNGANPAPLSPNADGTSSASCAVTFAHSVNPVGQLTVTAAYSDTVDSNFSVSASSTVQTVQDFNVTLSVKQGNSNSVSSPAGVYITQGNTTATDTFGPATISILMSTSPAYNPAMAVTCEVYSNNPAAALTDPSCVPVVGQTVNITQNAGAQAFVINASATATPASYIVRLTASDPNFANVSRFVEVPLNIVAKSASLSIASGATGTEDVSFLTPGGISSINIASFSCPKIWDTTQLAMLDNSTASLAVCSGVTGSTPTNGASTSVPVSITAAAKTTTTARNQQPLTTTYLAGLVGVPIFGVLAWFGTRRSSRRNFLRFFGLVLLLAGVSYATGCGGSFSKPTPPVATGIGAGSYLVQVVATDTSGAKYYAEVPIVVVK